MLMLAPDEGVGFFFLHSRTHPVRRGAWAESLSLWLVGEPSTVSPVRGDAAFDFRARQRFLEHLVAHIDSLEAYFMYRLLHSRQILLGRYRLRRFLCGFLIVHLLVLIDDFHRPGDHFFEPAAL